MQIHVDANLLYRMASEAAKAAPRECCGLLLGRGATIEAIVPCRNIHPDPEGYFEIDPQMLIDAHRAARSGGPQVLGYYHSHPGGQSRPSPVDQAMAHGDGKVWAIIGGSGITFWRDRAEGFQPLSPA
jgi:proteasome lid subunit RPN8/RPN11